MRPYEFPTGMNDETPPDLMAKLRRAARSVLPHQLRRWTHRWAGSTRFVPPIGKADFGDLRRLKPMSRVYGFDRGRPIDRFYIETFLDRNGGDIRGRVLEIGETTYTRRFGRGVTQSDMLHVHAGVEGATFVDDLAEGRSLPTAAFDCVILTQTLHLIFDMRAAVATVERILKPGGVLLCTVPGITQVSDPRWNASWYWSLTGSGANRLFKDVFPPDRVQVETFGNVLAATAFLQGLAEGELDRAELAFQDPEYPVTVAVRAISPGPAENG
jgi:SAM-dependent methyltransferase